MYIISKHKDYYDSAVGMGIDKTIVYERHLNDMHVPKDIKEILKENKDRYGDDFSFTTTYGTYGDIPKGESESNVVIVGFCGKLYLGVKYKKNIGRSRLGDQIYKKEIIYDHDIIRSRLSTDTKRSKYLWKQKKQSDLEKFNNYILKFNAIDVSEWFIRFKTPIFTYGYGLPNDVVDYNTNSGSNFYINPILKDYQFMKVFDPYTAFQEIQMYVSGVLGTKENDTIKIEDKYKIDQHGYDKWSFRREPSK